MVWVTQEKVQRGGLRAVSGAKRKFERAYGFWNSLAENLESFLKDVEAFLEVEQDHFGVMKLASKQIEENEKLQFEIESARLSCALKLQLKKK